MADLELWSPLDLEPLLRPVSLDDDDVVAGVSIVHVADCEPPAAIVDADVVCLGPCSRSNLSLCSCACAIGVDSSQSNVAGPKDVG